MRATLSTAIRKPSQRLMTSRDELSKVLAGPKGSLSRRQGGRIASRCKVGSARRKDQQRSISIPASAVTYIILLKSSISCHSLLRFCIIPAQFCNGSDLLFACISSDILGCAHQPENYTTRVQQQMLRGPPRDSFYHAVFVRAIRTVKWR